jgi:hypothetical protein
MSSVEWSERSRRLAGVDQALLDGRARPPGELLDQLRERLGRLEPNHPSAYPRLADSPGSPEPGGGERPESSDLVEAGEESERLVRGEAASEREAGDARGGGSSSGFGLDSGFGSGLGAGSGAGSGDVDEMGSSGSGGLGDGQGLLDGGPVRPGHGDPYQPWFMSGELGAPWFAE